MRVRTWWSSGAARSTRSFGRRTYGNYNDISDEERQAAVRIAERELATHLQLPEERLKICVDNVIRTLWRYRVKGTICSPGAQGWLSVDNSPVFSLILNADGGLPGDYEVSGLSINR